MYLKRLEMNKFCLHPYIYIIVRNNDMASFFIFFYADSTACSTVFGISFKIFNKRKWFFMLFNYREYMMVLLVH